MLHFKSSQPDPFLKKPAPYSDGGLAKFGHLNAIVDRLNGVTAGPVTINASATATAEQVAHGVIVSSSPSPVSITLPSASDIAEVIGAGSGVSFWLTIDNSAGSNPVTLVLGTGTTANTGSSLVTAASSLGLFRIHFTSPITAIIIRVA